MASILFGTAITDARGSQGGTVFSRNRNGAYTRIKTQPINPNTIPQQVRRSAFAATSASWRSLSTAQQQSWISAAPMYPYTNRVGVVSTYTGFQLFAKVNNQMRSIDAPPIAVEVAPVLVPAVYIRASTFASTSQILTIQVQFGDDVNATVPVGCVLVVAATGHLSMGVNSPKQKNFRQIAFVNAGTDIEATVFQDQYFSLYGYKPNDASNTFVEIFLVNLTTGQVSPKVFVKVVVTP